MKRLMVYTAKCVTGVVVSFLLARILNYNDFIWCLISIILVLSPDGKDAVPLAVNRMKANVVGAFAGLLMLSLHPPTLIMVTGGVIITIVVCYLTNLENPTRTALAATIIVTLHEGGRHIWDVALERVIAVLAGCVLGMLITYLFHSRFITGPSEISLKQEEA